MADRLMAPAETKQNASLEDGRRDAVRQTLDYTPGAHTHTHTPVLFPTAAFSEAGHCALPEGSGAARQPAEVGANLLQSYASLEARAPSTLARTL